jgi:hypothetical protein
MNFSSDIKRETDAEYKRGFGLSANYIAHFSRKPKLTFVFMTLNICLILMNIGKHSTSY